MKLQITGLFTSEALKCITWLFTIQHSPGSPGLKTHTLGCSPCCPDSYPGPHTKRPLKSFTDDLACALTFQNSAKALGGGALPDHRQYMLNYAGGIFREHVFDKVTLYLTTNVAQNADAPHLLFKTSDGSPQSWSTPVEPVHQSSFCRTFLLSPHWGMCLLKVTVPLLMLFFPFLSLKNSFSPLKTNHNVTFSLKPSLTFPTPFYILLLLDTAFQGPCLVHRTCT